MNPSRALRPSPARVGLSTASVYPETTAAAFELAAKLGYDGVEVMVWTDPISQDPQALLRLSEHYGVPMGEYETAQLACAIEREDLGIAGGMQDMYAATFGGFNFIEFTDRVIVNPLRIRDATAFELEMSLLLCYTGITRDSARVIEDQTRRATTGSEDTLAGLRAQKELAVAMKAALLTGKLNDFGAMMGEAWTQKKRMSPYITNERIDELYDVAMHNGALGGKLTGAGGGGYILLFCDFAKKHRLIEALEFAGATITEFAFESKGLTTWQA